MKENKLEEMRTLIEELHAASSAYYNKQPIMQNFEYDLKCKQLIALEKETGFTYPDSPTLKVGAAIEKQSSLAPVKSACWNNFCYYRKTQSLRKS